MIIIELKNIQINSEISGLVPAGCLLVSTLLRASSLLLFLCLLLILCLLVLRLLLLLLLALSVFLAIVKLDEVFLVALVTVDCDILHFEVLGLFDRLLLLGLGDARNPSEYGVGPG